MSAHDLPDSPTRPMSSSRSFLASSTAGTSSSRPFLNMLNPMAAGGGRKYTGYMQANQSVLEEEEENDDEDGNKDDLEAGRVNRGESNIFHNPPGASLARSTLGGRRVSWGRENAELSVLRPNIHSQDAAADSSDDEVPQSFMIEASAPRRKSSLRSGKGKARAMDGSARVGIADSRGTPPLLPVGAQVPPGARVSIPPRPSEVDPEQDPEISTAPTTSPLPPKPMRGLDAYERALWNWVNVYNLDAFLQEVYFYYEGKGIYCIALSRALNLLTVGFVIAFSTFLLGCIDYLRIRPEGITRLSDVVVDKCISRFSGFSFLFFVLFITFYGWQIFTFLMGMRRLIDMYHFYTYLLRIPDEDIQTISWPEIVRRIAAIREENPLTALSSAQGPHSTTTQAKLDAHDIANRIMRQENYLIALFNKELLDLRVPLPGVLSRFVASEEGKGRTLTRALEWNLRFCLMEYLFDPNGKVRKVFLKSRNRTALVEGLRRRLIFMGILNAIFAPFIVLYLIMYSFFRYFEEYHKNPSSIGGRKYTPFALWKFREFNELPHLFTRRLDESYPTANIYIAQFPNEKMTLIMRFVSFIAGSFAAVLVFASVLDPDLVVHFEVTPHRTVLFYIGIFGSILAVARGMVPDEHRVFDPEELMADLLQYTRYMPDAWKGQLHSKKVHQEFGELFVMKIMIYAQELLSVILTPFVLWFSLPSCAPAIVDFFREFTVHVDGLGYVCSFAVFDFQRHGNIKFGAPTQVSDERLMSKEGKMEKSFLNFKAAHPDWNPTDPSGSLYLSRMADYTNPHAYRRPRATIAESVVLNAPGAASEDKGHSYERALLQSQTAAARRRRQPGLGASTMLGQSTAGAADSVYQRGMARTAVLGDSTGSVRSPPTPTQQKLPPEISTAKPIRAEDVTPDDGVGSGLGDSYVDGTGLASPGPEQSQREEEELEDGGVLGLLAQIYGTKGQAQGPARVI